MSRATMAAATALLVLTPGCNYIRDLKPGDSYMLILAAGLVGMMVLFGIITQGRDEILDENITKVQRHKESIHQAEDEVRLKRDALYRAQQELLGLYEKVLTEAQRSGPEIVAQRRRLLELEREIVLAEGRREQLKRHEPVA
jgi:vacuolar-type H+-ATPase subunit H